MEEFDLVVIGAGPAGEKAAVKAAYFGKKVAIVEKNQRVGGAGVLTGTLPSKTLKESALYFSGKNDKGLYGIDRVLSRHTTAEDFLYSKDCITRSESDAMAKNLSQHQVKLFKGKARFTDAHTLIIDTINKKINANNILIATGSYPYHPVDIPFNKHNIHDSDTILDIKHMPESICIVGAGVIGCEYATIFATMGAKVYLINHSNNVLGFLDEEVTTYLVDEMKQQGVEILFNTSISQVESQQACVEVGLNNGDKLMVDMFLFAAGRQAQTHELDCDKAQIKLGNRGVVDVNDHYQSNQAHIYAVGDAIGFPALASTSMEQGRVAVSHMFHLNDITSLSEIYPYGIYTVPEVSMVGITEQQALELAQNQGLNFCVGRAAYKDLPRGKIMGCKSGFMKLIFDSDTFEILGVHIIGSIAAELIHYGVSLLENKKTVHQIIGSVFNFPTLHDLYKYACYDGLGNLHGHKIRIPEL